MSFLDGSSALDNEPARDVWSDPLGGNFNTPMDRAVRIEAFTNTCAEALAAIDKASSLLGGIDRAKLTAIAARMALYRDAYEHAAEGLNAAVDKVIAAIDAGNYDAP